MNGTRINFLILAFLCVLLPGPAQTADITITAEDIIHQRIGGASLAGGAVDQIRSNFWFIFNRIDVDGGGITPRDQELAWTIADANQRAHWIAETLAYDLDGDAVVTVPELEIAFGQRSRLTEKGLPADSETSKKQLNALVAQVMQRDDNHDGQLNISELAGGAGNERFIRIHDRTPSFFEDPLLDSNKDGVIAWTEVERVLERVIREIDSDGDGKISESERAAEVSRYNKFLLKSQAAAHARLSIELFAKRSKECSLPKPPEGARIILLGVYSGSAITDVGVGGSERTITAAEIDIETGSSPLYIIATSALPVVWLVKGDVGRVVEFVASAAVGKDQVPRVGVFGLPKSKVTIAGKTDCFPYFTDAREEAVLRANWALTAYLGRRPDAVFGGTRIATISLPTGRHNANGFISNDDSQPTAGPAGEMWQKLLRPAPGGLVKLPPEQVVAALPVLSLDLLPHYAGLAQLLESGAIERIGNKQEYRVHRAIKLPVDLYLVEPMTFIVDEDVPLPDGIPGHLLIEAE